MKTLIESIKSQASPSKAEVLKRYFKTGPGEYGEGDVFLGLTVPQARKIAKEYLHLSFDELKQHLRSKIHEERLIALMILVQRYENNEKERKKIFDFYFSNTAGINNWDLVDTSASYIAGHFLFDKKKDFLYSLAKSPSLWERRIAIVSTYHFIRNGELKETFKLAEILMNDRHDLIHKAVGWMLREAGKKSKPELEAFLRKHHKVMPRTMLRYSIERFPEKERKFYLGKK